MRRVMKRGCRQALRLRGEGLLPGTTNVGGRPLLGRPSPSAERQPGSVLLSQTSRVLAAAVPTGPAAAGGAVAPSVAVAVLVEVLGTLLARTKPAALHLAAHSAVFIVTVVLSIWAASE